MRSDIGRAGHISKTAEAAPATATPRRSLRWLHVQSAEPSTGSPTSPIATNSTHAVTSSPQHVRGIPTGIDLASTSAASLAAAARPSPPANLRFFMMGAAAAVSIHYLVDFIGTLPLVRYLVRRFIWQSRENEPETDADAGDGAASNTINYTGLEADDETVEWVNMCWRKAWRIYQRGLERWLAGLLQPVLDNLVADGMVPRFVQRLRIAEFTLDHEAPYFSNMRRRNSRKDSDLTGVVDVRYTGGARMLLLIECGTGRWRIKVPVMVSDLDLECTTWVKLRLAPMCPWVGTVSLAFAGPPTIKVQLSPYNRVRLMRIPILQPFLSKLFTKDLPELMTLPRRLEINIPPAVTAVAEAAVGRDAVMRAVASAVLQADALEHALISALPLGPQGAAGGISLPDLFGGELQVVLKEAKNLPVWGFPWQSNPYCRILLGSQAVRSRKDSETSQTSGHRAPVWNQEFQFLVEDPSVQTLEILIADSPITGRTDVGGARFKLADLPTDRSTFDVWLPVESSMPGENIQGAVHLSLTYRPFQDDEADSGYREAKAWAKAITSSQDELDNDGNPMMNQITDVKSAADASSRAAVAASAAAAAVAVTKAAAARAAARLARAARGEAANREAAAAKVKGDNEAENDATSSDDDDDESSSTPSLLLPPPIEMKLVDGGSINNDDSSNGNDNGNGSFAATNGAASAPLDVSTLSTLPAATDPADQEEAVAQLEKMATTMQQLTQEVHDLNLSTSSVPHADAAAAEAAAKAVAAAEALAVTAVVAGDVRAANAALQEAAAALEKTAVKLVKERTTENNNSSGITNAHQQAAATTPTTTTAAAAAAAALVSPSSSSSSSPPSPLPPQTPEERAAAALAAAQAAAAAAAAAVAKDPGSHSIIPTNNSKNGFNLSIDTEDDDPIASLAADAIPSASLDTPLSTNGAAAALISTDADESDQRRHPQHRQASQTWWSRALQWIPIPGKAPAAHDSAADAVADADGSAAIAAPSSPWPRYSSGASKRTSARSKEGQEGEEEDGNGSSKLEKFNNKVKKTSDTEELSSPTDSLDGPVGDIIISPDLPLEEIAAEVQKSWKMRDVHVETMLQKAVASQQRRSERPWLVMTSVMATASAVLLSIVLYRLYNGQ